VCCISAPAGHVSAACAILGWMTTRERDRARKGGVELGLSEVLSGLSHALDITEGQARGHTERSCVIGMRLATALGFDEGARASLFYALLLKDAGCSSNASKVAALFGADDAAVKSSRRLTDTSSTPQALVHVLRTAGGAGSLMTRARYVGAVLGAGRDGARELIKLRCERGAAVAREIGLDEVTARAILDVDEHWDGGGYPAGLPGEQISPAGRVLCLAQTTEVFWRIGGPAGACDIARRRRGAWFDPALVDALLALEHDDAFWRSVESPRVETLEPLDRMLVADDECLNRVAHAFASVVDAKSPYTAHHSEGVAEIAVSLATLLEVDGEGRETLRRAALLHDIGKLGVSNRILDKPGRLGEEEWRAMRRHPQWTMEILGRVSAFEAEAQIASVHHERLDGSGYHRGLTAAYLDRPSRILAVADVAEALSANRPYRPALSPDEVLTIMRGDAQRALDPDAFTALSQVLPAWSAQMAPAG
jgi:putative nucleotidyltransferase with HDIG domain